MSYIWLEIDDEPGLNSVRGDIEKHAITMLNNYEREQLDPPSESWLGHFSNRPFVRGSGLWNQHHVEKSYGPSFIYDFEKLFKKGMDRR